MKPVIRKAADTLRRGRRPAAGRVEHDYVFVVTYGRSGSTLLQGMLNTLPRTVVRGENGLYVVHLFRAWQATQAIRRKRKGPPSRQPTNAFYGIDHVTRRRFVQSARRLAKGAILGPEQPRDVDRLGFKEVEWHKIEPDETAAFFDWFDDVFPGAMYLLNTREIDSVVGSGFWQRRDPDEAMQQIHRVIEIQEHLRATRPDRVLDVRYEVVTGEDRQASDEALRSIAEFVTGSCDEQLLQTLRGTLDVGHGPNPFGRSRHDRSRSRGGSEAGGAD